jgi:hypothetical protein
MARDPEKARARAARFKAKPGYAERRRGYDARHRAKHGDAIRERDAARKQRIRDETQAWVDAVKMERGCVDCGYRLHPRALDFDHVAGVKVASVSRLVFALASRARIDTEIAKCVVRCANCHRVKTWENGDHRSRASESPRA